MDSLLLFLGSCRPQGPLAQDFFNLVFLGSCGCKGRWRRISLLVYDVFPWLVNASWFSYARKKWLLRVFLC